ncbi:hypothetical protein LINPERPRIM_LOCUS28823, partial [Linum perenne]
LCRDWEVRISHVFRESNHVADHLTNRGHFVPFSFHVVEHSDPNFCYWLLISE